MENNLWTCFCPSHNVRYVTDSLANFIVGLANEGLLSHRGTPLSFPPSLSALCNLILLCTQAPPPRRLTFPLIHSEIPQGVNNYTLVYSHHTASPGLIQLIKVAAVNQLTDLGPLPILLLILFIGLPTVVDCVVGNVSRPGEEGERAVLYLPHLDRFSLCVAQVHTSSISLSVLSLWALGMLALLWSGFYQLPVTVI